MSSIDKAISGAFKTGKAFCGAKEAIGSAKNGKAKIFIMASNTPRNIRDDIKYYAKLSKIPVLTYSGTTFDLGRICSKSFPVAVVTVKDVGSSDILTIAESGAESMGEKGTQADVEET